MVTGVWVLWLETTNGSSPARTWNSFLSRLLGVPGARNMCIHADFRYGEDDPLQWPQPYFASDCHLGAIPLRPGPDDAMSVMWWEPEPKDFVLTTATTIGGLGLIDRKHFTYLSYMVSSLCSRAEE